VAARMSAKSGDNARCPTAFVWRRRIRIVSHLKYASSMARVCRSTAYVKRAKTMIAS